MSTDFTSKRFSILRDRHVLEHELLLLLVAREVGEAIARGRPRHPGHGVAAEPAWLRDVLEAEAGVEAAGQVADDLAVLGRHQDDVELLVLAVAAATAIRSPEGDGSIEMTETYCVLPRFGARSRP
jgi:hypothetical protein